MFDRDLNTPLKKEIRSHVSDFLMRLIVIFEVTDGCAFTLKNMENFDIASF